MPDIKGYFRVNKVNAFTPNVQYTVLFLKDRMLFIKTGGQLADGGLAGAVAGGALGGALGGLIGSSLEQKLQKNASQKKDEKLQHLLEMSPEELLQTDKKNFEVNFNDVSTVEMKHSVVSMNGARTGVFNLQGKTKAKFDIAPGQKYEDCYNLAKILLSEKLG